MYKSISPSQTLRDTLVFLFSMVSIRREYIAVSATLPVSLPKRSVYLQESRYRPIRANLG